jgi:hypothetical protein
MAFRGKLSGKLLTATIALALLVILASVLSRTPTSLGVGRGRGGARSGSGTASSTEAATSAASIVPATAYSFSELSLQLNAQALALPVQAGGSPPSSTRTVWSVNGTDVAEGGSLAPRWFSRGDVVSARVERVGPTGTPALLAQAQTKILNSPPDLRSVEIQSVPDSPGQVEAVVDAADPDGDAVTLLFAWSLGGKPIPDAAGKTMSVQELKRGETLMVSVTASDGVDASRQLRSAPYSFENHPPVLNVVDKAKVARSQDGSATVTFQLQVSDADGDPVAIDFPDAPGGVAWDAQNQSVIWTAAKDETKIAVVVRARDGKGGESQRKLELSL